MPSVLTVVWSCMRPGRTAPPTASGRARRRGGGLMGVLLGFAGDERPPPRPVGPWPADLGLGDVQAQLDPFGRCRGEHLRQAPKAQAGLAGDREPAPRQQRADLMDGAGDGGAVHPVQHRQGLVGQLEAQDHQGDQHPVGEDQLVVGPAPAARWRGWPRRCCRAAWWAAVQGSAGSTVSSARCCWSSPVKQGWVRAARAHAGVDTHA